MKKLDTYLDLHSQVYNIIQSKPHKGAYALFRSYAMETKGLILEPMCGSGCYLLTLAEEGFDVHGFDGSDYMLQALQAKAKEKNLNPTVWKGFIEDGPGNERYSLIFMASDSFCLISEKNTAKAFTQKVYNQLNEGGYFVFDIRTTKFPPLYTKIWLGDSFRRDDGKQIIRNLCTMPDLYNIRHTIMKYELIHNNQIIHTEIENEKIRHYDPEKLTNILTEIGFKQIKIFSAFNRETPFHSEDARVVFECKK